MVLPMVFSQELLLAGLQPALTELFAAPELHLGGSLGDFGIRHLGEHLEQTAGQEQETAG